MDGQSTGGNFSRWGGARFRLKLRMFRGRRIAVSVLILNDVIL